MGLGGGDQIVESKTMMLYGTRTYNKRYNGTCQKCGFTIWGYHGDHRCPGPLEVLNPDWGDEWDLFYSDDPEQAAIAYAEKHNDGWLEEFDVYVRKPGSEEVIVCTVRIERTVTHCASVNNEATERLRPTPPFENADKDEESGMEGYFDQSDA